MGKILMFLGDVCIFILICVGVTGCIEKNCPNYLSTCWNTSNSISYTLGAFIGIMIIVIPLRWLFKKITGGYNGKE